MPSTDVYYLHPDELENIICHRCPGPPVMPPRVIGPQSDKETHLCCMCGDAFHPYRYAFDGMVIESNNEMCASCWSEEATPINEQIALAEEECRII